MLFQLAKGRSLDEVLEVLARDRETYALEGNAEGAYHLVKADRWQTGQHTLAPYRPVESVRSVFFRPRDFLGSLSAPGPEKAGRPAVIFGVKNCDLSSLRIHDHVFRDTDPPDPCYAEARESALVVSCDCTDCLEVCFCPAVGEQPYPTGGFDINLSVLPEGCVLESGTPAGEEALKAAEDALTPMDPALGEARNRQREAMQAKVAAQAEAQGLKAGLDYRRAIQATAGAELWEDFAEDCVECGACNFACCTCHCFLLADGKTVNGETARVKQWDSCLWHYFGQVAGGGNPRHRRALRLRNRFEKKFDFFPEILGEYACDGCGRCTEACIGKIDIRKVLKRAVDEAESIPAGTGSH